MLLTDQDCKNLQWDLPQGGPEHVPFMEHLYGQEKMDEMSFGMWRRFPYQPEMVEEDLMDFGEPAVREYYSSTKPFRWIGRSLTAFLREQRAIYELAAEDKTHTIHEHARGNLDMLDEVDALISYLTRAGHINVQEE